MLRSSSSQAGLAASVVAVLVLLGSPALAQDDPCCTESEVMSCQDGLWCSGMESCNCYGDCEPGIPRNCDDGDVCTRDYCREYGPIIPGTLGSGYCDHEFICGTTGCVTDADCDDGDLCTDDTCDPATGTCVNETFCDDDNVCTANECDPATGTCLYPAISCDDGDLCTIDDCDPVGGCFYVAVSCDDGDVCTIDGCDPATGCTATFIPDCCYDDLDCLWMEDGHACTVEYCDFTASPYPQCAVYSTPLNDDCATAGFMPDGGGTWTYTGDTYCNNDLYGATAFYPVTPCGYGSGPDAVLYYTIAEEYQLYQYRLYAEDLEVLPLDYNMQVCMYYPYTQAPLWPSTTGVCDGSGVESEALDPARLLMCSEYRQDATCYSGLALDSTDACRRTYNWHSPPPAGEQNMPVLPDGSYNIILDTAGPPAVGNDYTTWVDRTPVENFACDDGDPSVGGADSIEPPEIQMGGVWTGHTDSYSALPGAGFCSAQEIRDLGYEPAGATCIELNPGCDCDTHYYCFVQEYARAEFRINHLTSQWSQNTGYVIETEVPASAGFTTSLLLTGESCNKNCNCEFFLSADPSDPEEIPGCTGTEAQGCPMGCDASSGSWTGGMAKLVTGVIPAGRMASLALTGYYHSGHSGEAWEGNYKLVVKRDVEGDGLPDGEDPSDGAMWGNTYNGADLVDGAIRVSLSDGNFSDSRTTRGYTNTLSTLRGSANICKQEENVCVHSTWGICDDWEWQCTANSTMNSSSGDVFYRITNDTGGSRAVRVCMRAMANKETWETSYAWDSWAPLMCYSDDGGTSWPCLRTCAYDDGGWFGTERYYCNFEGDKITADATIPAGATWYFAVTGLDDYTGADQSRGGWYNFQVCDPGDANCCTMSDYYPGGTDIRRED